MIVSPKTCQIFQGLLAVKGKKQNRPALCQQRRRAVSLFTMVGKGLIVFFKGQNRSGFSVDLIGVFPTALPKFHIVLWDPVVNFIFCPKLAHLF